MNLISVTLGCLRGFAVPSTCALWDRAFSRAPSGRHADVYSCVYPAPHGCSQHKQVLTDFSGLQDIIQQAADTS